jgi:hypothetical protein
MAISVSAYRVNVTKHFSDGGSQITEVLILSDSAAAAEQTVRTSMQYTGVLAATSLARIIRDVEKRKASNCV